MTIFTTLIACGSLLSSIVLAASSADWRTRSIYQVLTDRFARSDGSITATCNTGDSVYCGGSFQGIIDRLDYIQGMGFDAIWISPVTAQLTGQTPDGSSYHGYWQQNLYEINPSFGTAADLKALSAALRTRKMYLMVDVVFNHFAYWGAPADVDYSKFTPFNSVSYFHPFCEINYGDLTDTANIERCWEGDTTVPLPDLRTENSNVKSMFHTWITEMVSNYSIDGLRVDSALQSNTSFLQTINPGVYMIGEVDAGDAGLVCGFQKYMPGVLNYATYFPLVAAFQNTSGNTFNYADSINAVKSDCSDTSLIGSFSENHDQPRFASLTSDMSQAMNVISATILSDGIPIIYEGQEQHYNALGGSSVPFNREAIWFSGYNKDVPLYKLVTTLNAARKQAIKNDASYLSYQNWPIYVDTTTIAMRKGNMVTVLSNKGANGASYTQSIPAGYASGTKVTEILTCATLTANSNGNIVVPMAQGLPRIYYPTSGLSGSGICSSSNRKSRSLGHSAKFTSQREEA